MRLSSLMSVSGFLLLLCGTYCPLFRPLHLLNWNLYQASLPYGLLLMLVAVAGLIGVAMRERRLIRMAAVSGLVLVVLLYLLSSLKIHLAFRFVPFHNIGRMLEHQVRFKWGWWLLGAGPVLALFGSLGQRPQFKAPRRHVND